MVQYSVEGSNANRRFLGGDKKKPRKRESRCVAVNNIRFPVISIETEIHLANFGILTARW
jgi:hypothetical protein